VAKNDRNDNAEGKVEHTPADPVNKPGRKVSFSRLATGIVLAVFIFGLGVSVGSGRITIGRDSIFRKSIQSGKLPANLDYSSVDQVYNDLKQEYDGQLDATKLLEGMKEGLAKASGDAYTEYLSPKDAKDFDNELKGTFSGIGAELSKDKNGNIIVISPIAGYPADKAGLKPKDIIAEIDGQSTADLSITEAVNKIRGTVGTKVKLKAIRNNSQELDLEITREQITIPSVESQVLDGNIGYIKISRFAEDTSNLASQAATKFKDAKVRGVILDLRSDPGGLLDAAVDVSSLWLPSGKTILQERRGGVTVRTYSSKGTATLQGVPTVALINEGSASASEITAGALKDNNAAKLIGVKSFGKGSVQQLEKLSDGGVLKVTIARWYTPGGKNIDKEGISPDQEVKLSDDDFKNNRDPQKDTAINFLKK
jgi:carboxyl-terminal processing protease